MTSITTTAITPATSKAIGRSWAQRTRRLIIYLLLFALVMMFLVPVYLVVITSLKTLPELDLLDVWRLPQALNLSSFGDALGQLAPYLLNSLMLTIPATIISAMLGSLNGYVLSKWH